LANYDGMVKKMIKTIKHGLLVVSLANIQGWDLQVLNILFEYHYGIQNNTKYSPYMIVT
jgi:hypothetical protein